MSLRSIFKMSSVVLVGVVIPHFARADYEVDRLMNSYIIAKAEVAQTPSTEDEAKAHPYTVQVASYINEKDAVSHLDELKPQVKMQKLRYFPTFVHGQVWYKVCVGEFVTKEEAETFKKDFVKKTDEPFAVVISLLDRPKYDKTPDADADGKVVAKDGKKRKPASKGDDKDTPFGGNDKDDELSTVPTFNNEKPMKVALADPKAEVPKAAVAVKKADVKNEIKKEIKTGDFYSLQVGAFPTENLAKENMSKMDSKQEAFVQPATVNGKQWFRVYVGKFKSKKEAEVFQKSLAGKESFIRHVTK